LRKLPFRLRRQNVTQRWVRVSSATSFRRKLAKPLNRARARAVELLMEEWQREVGPEIYGTGVEEIT